MKPVNYTFILATAILIVTFSGCSTSVHNLNDQRDLLFNDNWKFIRDSLPSGAEQPGYDDRQWLSVDLPHDWSIMDLPDRQTGLPGEDNEDQIGPFSKSSPGSTSTGYVKGGTGWYRKHFMLRKADAGKTAVLRFDGVYMEAEVWVNGKKAGNHVYGYTPFWFDITPLLQEPGKDNVIAVKVTNTGRNSRWYSGSGIYRNVHLSLMQPVHIAVWGVQVTTRLESDSLAVADLRITVQNDSPDSAETMIITKITDPQGNTVTQAETEIEIGPKSKICIRQSVEIPRPLLWSVESPVQYRADLKVLVDGKEKDRFAQLFGVRTIDISVEKGLLLNGKPIELKGGCLHHDNGLLGAAAFERAEERRVEIMKANGFNAIRTSHNPPSEAFLNACDRLGMLVIDETFDMWERPKNPMDYHRYFREWWQKDVESMILRDRNHPSIIFWSIGNEINERADSSGLRIARSLISFIGQYDSTRAFTNAICEFWDIPGKSWDATAPAFELLTVGGYNYQYQRYEPDHERFPERIMMGTESVPMDAFGNWQQVVKHPWVIGDFVWTGMDYLGETGIGHTQYLTEGQQDVFAMPWPWFNAWCGDIDLIGDKKPQMFYRDVIWGNSRLEMNVHAPVPEDKIEKISYWGWYDEWPNWNWQGHEDKPLRVSVYTTGSRVKLELNGRVIGEKDVSLDTRFTAVFDVNYEPGELIATAYENEKEIAARKLRTTGAPAAIRLLPDRNPIRADRNDLCYIGIEIIDEFGQVVTDAAREVKVTLAGNGELVGIGNACPYDMKSFGNPLVTTYHGKAMAIVRPFARSGSFTLSAEGKGVTPCSLEVQTK